MRSLWLAFSQKHLKDAHAFTVRGVPLYTGQWIYYHDCAVKEHVVWMQNCMYCKSYMNVLD